MFYAAEAAIVAIADRAGIETKQRHWLKAEAATELHERGVLDEDCGPLLRQLNQARKDVWYEVLKGAFALDLRLPAHSARSHRASAPTKALPTLSAASRQRSENSSWNEPAYEPDGNHPAPSDLIRSRPRESLLHASHARDNAGLSCAIRLSFV